MLIEDLVIPSGVPTIGIGAFSGALSLKTITIPSSTTSIRNNAFKNCKNVHTIFLEGEITVSETALADIGSLVSDTPKTIFVSPGSISFYQTSAWAQIGFEIVPNINITECTSLTITADDVTGRDTSTSIYWEAVVNGTDPITGQRMENVIISGKSVSESFPQNTSETEELEITVFFTYMGITASTTIIQGVWVPSGYTLNLNNNWQTSTVTNPDSALYDGVYESFSNKGVNNGVAVMYIDIFGYETFNFYIRSYAESNYDYVIVSQPDAEITGSTEVGNTTLVKAHTKGIQKSGTALSDYTLVEFTNIDGDNHRITVLYRKDSSENSGDDRGYILIPKNQ